MVLSNLSAASLMFQALPGVSSIPTCTDEAFSSLKLDKAEILSVTANISSVNLPASPTNEWPKNPEDTVTLCKVVIQYTHPGWNDTINTYVWLPVSDWNERMVGVGGGGWSAGDVDHLAAPASRGYAAVTTDGGHLLANRQELGWALTSSGNLDLHALQNFAAVSLDDAATLGKTVVEAYYGKKPKYSYWNVSNPR